MTAVTVGRGLTVTVNVLGVPAHVVPPLEMVGVTVKVLVKGDPPELAVVKAGTLPEPDVGVNPMDPAVRVQLNTVPGSGPENVVEGALWPTQKVWLATESTVGAESTVIVWFLELVQLFASV